MKTVVKHIAALSRRLAVAPPAQTIGFLPAKSNWMKSHRFKTFNFSFILAGAGVYHHRGRELEVAAPCVITQWPDDPMVYGPHKEWFEIYIMYPASAGVMLRDRNLFDQDRPMWAIGQPDALMQGVRRLYDMLTAGMPPDPDRVDHLCEELVMESLLAVPPKPCGVPDRVVHEIAARLAGDFEHPPDFEKMALAHGMSLATFHRHWRRRMKTSPAQYRAARAMDEARRLLVETGEPIKQIAARLGFADQLYFTKKFHRLTGISPGKYRRRQRLPLDDR